MNSATTQLTEQDLAAIRDAADDAHTAALEVIARGRYTREDLAEMRRAEKALAEACDAHARAVAQ